jgi:proteasome assembly chaperone (PAC2) family protein
MDREHIVFERRPALHNPVVVMAVRGWNDAGEAASGATDWIKHQLSAHRFAHIDPEEFFDFQVARPTVELVDGTTRRIDWPANEFHYAKSGDRDIVIFSGLEPNLRWRTFSEAIVSVCREIGAERLVTLGAFLADVPHTKDVPVVGSASSPEEAMELGLSPSRYEGPTGIVGVAHDAANRAGISSVSFWAAIPHYIPAGVNPKASLALVERLAMFLEIELDTGQLRPAADAWEQSVTDQVDENETLSGYVHRLEEAGADDVEMETETADGEAIADEIERFLEERSGGNDTA